MCQTEGDHPNSCSNPVLTPSIEAERADLESDGSGPRDVELGPEHAQAHMVQQVLLPPTRHG